MSEENWPLCSVFIRPLASWRPKLVVSFLQNVYKFSRIEKKKYVGYEKKMFHNIGIDNSSVREAYLRPRITNVTAATEKKDPDHAIAFHLPDA